MTVAGNQLALIIPISCFHYRLACWLALNAVVLNISLLLPYECFFFSWWMYTNKKEQKSKNVWYFEP